MRNNRVIGIIGDASIELQTQYELAFLMGKKLIDSGYIIATGGLGGVMEAASKGALNSSNYDKKSVIAVLPNYDFSSANAYSDIVLPLGNGIERNGNLISICDAVIAIGGGAGTLSEISTAWQMGKLIICLGNYGWSGKLKNIKLDSRRDDYIYGAADENEAILILNEKIGLYEQAYKGICTNFSSDYAISIIKSKYAKEDVALLGKGKSGIVVGNKNKVFKVFFDDSFELQAYLDSICKKLSCFGIKSEIENIEGKIILKTNIYGKELKYSDIYFT
ncbi:LOG family protein, partial [Treponema pedis]|uniref:SLOG cluster 4 domain-containing protein n=1 Tax=Treponema pedis TaxID=409322 RepID=UPI0006873DEB